MIDLAAHKMRFLTAWAIFAMLTGGALATGLVISQHLRTTHKAAMGSLIEETRRTRALVKMAPLIEAQAAQLDQDITASGILIDAPSRQQGFAIIQSYVDQVVSDRGGSIARIAPQDADDVDAGSVTISVEYRAEATSALEILASLEHGQPMLFPRSVTMNAVRLPGATADATDIDLRITAEFSAFLNEETP